MSTLPCTLLPLILLAGDAGADKGTIYAGIEIGGRGVKATVVQAQPDGVYRRLFAKTQNTTLSVLEAGAFKQNAIDDTVNAIVSLTKAISEKYKVPAERIVVVGSSGVPKASNRDAFVAAVKKATGKELRFIDDRTEVELTIAGIVPREQRDQTIALDIGGGNTKGGYKPAGAPLVYVAVPLGTVTFTQRASKEAKDQKLSFAEAVARLRERELVAPLRKGAKAMPELSTRKRVYLSGGSVWAMVTLMKPESVDRVYVTFTAADVKAFRALVRKNPDAFPPAAMSRITAPELKKRAEKEIKSVQASYGPENLIAGAEILSGLVEAFELEGKTIIFPRNGYVGWLAAYITGETLEEPRAKGK
jgi:exopolyphosphatase/pppGpp-phosphohydrolase